MAVIDVIIGYVRGLKGDTGETGATGATGEAATISVGTVSTAAYGQQAQVTNVGTSGAAVFDFVIPEGRPGEVLADMSNLTNNTITTSTSEFPVPAVGDTGATLWGKVVKFFSDIRAAVNAKIDASKITTSLAVTTAGSVADATVSKVLNDKITTLNDSLTPLNSYVRDYISVPTLDNGENYLNGCAYKRIGAFVVVYICVAFQTPPTNVKIFTMPQGYRPARSTTISGSGGSSYLSRATCSINNDGSIKVSSEDKWVYCFCIYAAAY